MQHTELKVLNSIASRALYLATQMIHIANHRAEKEKGDPKVGGHPSASSSALHILGTLHLILRSGFDLIANKPHASPTDHAYNYLLDLFLNDDFSRMSKDQANVAMMGLRKFPDHDEAVFQSYHSSYDPDHYGFAPSGTLGIPPVMMGYLASAYRFSQNRGFEIPTAHFWAIVGDSEFREGSLVEAMPDLAEREVGNLTWIVDYNRQSLDGHRITNKSIMGGTDDIRIERTARANGWDVIQVKHGQFRKEIFKRPGGILFQDFLENRLEDYELQALLLIHNIPALKQGLLKFHPDLKEFLESMGDDELFKALRDFGGHDFVSLHEALLESKNDPRRPCLVIAHTIKGWGLECAAQQGNHSDLPTQEEVDSLKQKEGIKNELFARFSEGTEEGIFLKKRSQELYGEFSKGQELKKRNQNKFKSFLTHQFPNSLEINLKMASYPHTQWMLGQLTAKLTRIANTSENNPQRPLSSSELIWKHPGELLVTMAPDVGTSTNLNPAMDGKIFGVAVVPDFEKQLGVKDNKVPDLVPGEEAGDRFLRFDISEANVMSCLGSYGQIQNILGIPLLPLMSVYDFFIKRALDQYFYNLYWHSSFILVGTPSGITLSPEGAQHGWKSDFQIPNQITWEPFFCQELDWIFCDLFKRHFLEDHQNRSGVLLRCVTRGVDQKLFLTWLKRQKRFKKSNELLSMNGFSLPGAILELDIEPLSEEIILEQIRSEVLGGAYFLINYEGYAGYEPGDNVVHLFSMGSVTTEAISASEKLLEKGIYANVVVITSPDLLLGNLAHSNNYEHLKKTLGISGKLYLHPQSHSSSSEWNMIAGSQIPIVSLHDGEPGLLDNIGSIVGVKQECLAVRKHSRCGRPSQVYQFHQIDSLSVIEAALKILNETAFESTEFRGLDKGNVID